MRPRHLVKLLLAIRANCRNSQSTFFIRVPVKVMQSWPQQTRDFCSLSHREKARTDFSITRLVLALRNFPVASFRPNLCKTQRRQSDQLIFSAVIATAGITGNITYIRNAYALRALAR